jgi:hypothetical protein
MPKAFDFPAGPDAWTTMSFGRERGVRSLSVVARPKPNVSFEQARAEMDIPPRTQPSTLSFRLLT